MSSGMSETGRLSLTSGWRGIKGVVLLLGGCFSFFSLFFFPLSNLSAEFISLGGIGIRCVCLLLAGDRPLAFS